MDEKKEKVILINKKHMVIFFSCVGTVVVLLTIGITILCIGLFQNKEKTKDKGYETELQLTSKDNEEKDSGTKEKEETKEITQAEDMVYDEVKSLIEKGDYQKAYDLLLQVKEQTMAQEMLKHFEYKLSKVVDENGNVVESYEYNNKGNCVVAEKSMFFLNGETERIGFGIHRYTYNGNGYVIRDECIEDESEYITIYMYDENGNCVREEDGSSYHNYTYDKDNNLVRENYSDYNSIKTIKVFVYDSNGLLSQERYYCSEPFETSYDYEINYEYDNQGRIVKMIEDAHDGFEKTINTYIYDESGNCIEENMDYGRGWEIDNSKIQYDDNGNILTINTFFSAPMGGVYEEHTLTFCYTVIYKDDLNNNSISADKELEDNKSQRVILTEKQINDIYSKKIDEYRLAANMDGEELFDRYQGECSSINTYILSEYCYYGGEISYALYDIDANGIRELIFILDGSIIDLYSISNGEVVKLFPDCYFGVRSRLYILDNGIVLNEGSNGADSSSMTKYYLFDDGDSVEIQEIMSYGYDESKGYFEDVAYKNEIGYVVYYEISSDKYIDILDDLLSNDVTDSLVKNIIAYR